MANSLHVVLTYLLLGCLANAAAICNLPALSSKASTPVTAAGYSARLIATGLNAPRFIKFDGAGRLLVVESGKGVTALTFKDYGGSCLQLASKTTVIADSSLNHGLAFSLDYKTLYASSPQEVKRWSYNQTTGQVTSGPTVIINGMGGSDHVTRTLLVSRFAPNQLVVTRGSTENLDPAAASLSSGHSQIRTFDVSNIRTPVDFTTSGKLLGWGLRNDVGVDEDPIYGGIWSVENSVDQMTRGGVDIHNTNPGEKLNYFGTLNYNTSPNQGGNFGYPDCYAAWNPSIIPNVPGLTVGMQFSIDGSNVTDAQCRQRVAPRNVLVAHTAPLSIRFVPDASFAYVSLHGSWDASPPVGYKVGMIRFSKGDSIQPPTSQQAFIDLVWNQDNTKCPGQCFRPVGLVWDNWGHRFYFSSDATGEIYVVSN